MKRAKTNTARAFIIAGTGSGAGKTVVTLGIMEALRRRGVVVQPFKAGPDYIDAGLHSALLKRPSYNLDTWMMGVEGVKRTFRAASAGVQLSIIEGVMGLFDGKDGLSDEGSTAHISKLLKIPVVLVVNAEKTARSAAAVVKGFKEFDGDVDVRWVVFNRIGSERHAGMLRDSVRGIRGLRCLGCVPRLEYLKVPERHLGLTAHGGLKKKFWSGFIKKAGDAAEDCLDMDALLGRLPKKREPHAPSYRAIRREEKVRIAVARDPAFSFYYEENLDILRRLGAEAVFFSPVNDRRLPSGVSGVYIGGGYPELYSKELSSNAGMMREIRDSALAGMPVYAECGGLMYLGRAIKDINGMSLKMAGIFPWTSKMLPRRNALGYREVTALAGCPFLKEGESARGHEFHYSEIKGAFRAPVKTVFEVEQAHGRPEKRREGYLYKNTLASYVHLHFASNPAFAGGFVRSCREFKEREKI